ncbi:MAG TPA: SusD/RagB family nutrient-binding outer membrane lipoprotein [Gemmatimonadaceae bacterium]|nr:SusD/RagB family nutrient-binding outer membrane lipoprotein [Gemmatimonadaceae bacterium]
MHRTFKLALVAALPAVLATGCSDWLTGSGLDNDPNRPTEGSVELLLVGVQAAQFNNITGGFARHAAMMTQQMAGTGNQYKQYYNYDYTENDYTQEFANIYGTGGLIDIRRIQAAARDDDDKALLGMAQVHEALLMGTAASIFGDLPYSEAINEEIATPKLDPQQEIYESLQALLDSAIDNLESAAAVKPNIKSADLIYKGDLAKWTEAAYTLKARYWMHVAEQLGTPAYQNAITAAQNGISTSANDMLTYQSAKSGEENLWWQFLDSRPGDMKSDPFLVNLMTSRSDPRLTDYFQPDGSGNVVGGTALLAADGRGAPEYRQPMVTWDENQLILAEAEFQVNGQAAAQPYLDAVRAKYGLPTGGAYPATLANIMEEKYVTLFQSVEVWNDYKRTCLPALTPKTGTEIPGRIFYGVDERNANPNIPAPGTDPNGKRNWNDPNAC